MYHKSSTWANHVMLGHMHVLYIYTISIRLNTTIYSNIFHCFMVPTLKMFSIFMIVFSLSTDALCSSTPRNLKAFTSNLTPSDQFFLTTFKCPWTCSCMRSWPELGCTGLPGASLKHSLKGDSPMSSLSLSYEAFCLRDII